MVRVWIVYQPHLLADLFERLFLSIDSVTVVPHPFGGLDVIVLPLNELGQPELDLLPYPVPPAKLIAVSPAADRALIRLPGATEWAEVRPFAVQELLAEVRAGRQRWAAPVPAARAMGTPPAWLGTELNRLASRLRASAQAWLAPRSRRLNRAVSMLTAVLVVAYYLSVGTIAAAEAAVPGEALYGVKRLTENAQLAVAPPAQDIELNAQFAERRLQEIEALAKRGIMLPDIIEDMTASTEAALNSSLPQPEAAHVLVALAELTRRQQQVLSTIVPDAADPATEAAVAHALQVSANGHQQAVAAITNIQAETGVAVAAVTPSPPAATATRIPLVAPTVAGPATAQGPSTPVAMATLASTGAPNPTTLPSLVPIFPTSEPSATNTATPRPSQTPAATASKTLEPTATPSSTLIPSATPSATASQTPQPTATDTVEPSATPSDTPTDPPEPTNTPTATPSDTPTSTPTDTPTWTPSPTQTPSPSDTPTSTPVPATETPTRTPSPTDTPTATPTDTSAPTNTPVPTNTPTATDTPGPANGPGEPTPTRVGPTGTPDPTGVAAPMPSLVPAQ